MTDTKASLLYEWISKKIDEKADLASIEGRKKDFEEFCNANPKVEFSKNHYNTLLKKILKQKNIDPRSYGLSQEIPTFNKTSSDMTAKIKPAPQSRTSSSSTPPESVKPTEQKSASQEELRDELPEDFEMNYTTENVGVTLKALYMFLKVRYPYIDDLSDDEKQDLGDLWLPAFKHYLKGKYAIVVIPFLATMGIVMPKIQEAKKQEIKLGKPKKLQCKFCKKRFEFDDVKDSHEKTCEKNPEKQS